MAGKKGRSGRNPLKQSNTEYVKIFFAIIKGYNTPYLLLNNFKLLDKDSQRDEKFPIYFSNAERRHVARISKKVRWLVREGFLMSERLKIKGNNVKYSINYEGLLKFIHKKIIERSPFTLVASEHYLEKIYHDKRNKELLEHYLQQVADQFFRDSNLSIKKNREIPKANPNNNQENLDENLIIFCKAVKGTTSYYKLYYILENFVRGIGISLSIQNYKMVKKKSYYHDFLLMCKGYYESIIINDMTEIASDLSLL
ncbi:hypothetical protein GF327_09575 [Candidatus Woesearchaeota archaeon]|nr:hypothetical protein [Candidatus Woesearchaeota archaeon]